MRNTKSRSRGNKNRNTNRPTGGSLINRVFDSSGPDGKVRGTPQQIIDKYNQLHRDAQLSNDRVNAENFAQHAEHYTRMLAEATREVDKQREEQDQQNRERQAERDRQMQADRDRQAERDREREANRERHAKNNDKADAVAEDDTAGDTGNDKVAEKNSGNGPRRTRSRADRAQQPADGPQAPETEQGAGDTRPARTQGRGHGQERADRLRAQEEAFNGPTPSMLLDPGTADQPDGTDDGPGLVDTPESAAKPARTPRPRKPRVPKAAKTDTPKTDAPKSSDAEAPDTPKADAASAGGSTATPDASEAAE